MPNCSRYSVGHEGSQGRPFHAGNPSKPEHAAREGRAGASRGNKAVRFAAAYFQHSLHRCAVHLFPYAHNRAFMVGDHFRRILQCQPVLHIPDISQEGLDFIQLPGQDDLQARVLAQSFNGTFDRRFRCQVSAHRVYIDLHAFPPV